MRIIGSLLIDFGLRLMPMMTSRMIVSLRRVAAAPQTLRSIEVPTGTQVGNSQDPHSLHPVDDIRLSVFEK